MINILSNYEPFTKNLINHFNIKEVRIFREFEHEILNSPVIIVEPFHIENYYCSVNSVWQSYLKQEYPENKLLVLGLFDFYHSNYIDFLHFPKDLKKFISNAKPVKDGLIKFPEEGFNVHQKIKQFFKGHGGKSVISQLSRIKFSIEAIYSNLDDFDEIQNDLIPNFLLPELTDLIKRWKSYSLFFPYLPFCKILNKFQISLISIVNELSKNISKQIIIDLLLQETIKDIIKNLFLIDKKYIRPELYEKDIVY